MQIQVNTYALCLFVDIEDIPESIKFCKNLQVLDFSCNPLSK